MSYQRRQGQNQLRVITENTTDARAQFIDAVERDRADHGLANATEQKVHGLVDYRPVRLVNAEMAAPTTQAEHTK
ncbi:hypothetical protein FM104_01855 [Microbacterium esteraromaticum]|uniref:Uncharacterized protein n=1 Tax=Microbacterium esteraromaticum TaxID=57043 RepID=A0A1R4IFK2_9MICO|nr:hypothetical protein FM104_01855 [Microbacterium esteraromaticum]